MQLEHPAIRAWRELRPLQAAPERIEGLEGEGSSTSVYRLVCADKARTNVIAKRSRSEVARIERTVYEEILPNLPFPTLNYYGCVAEPNGEFWWLYLEDASCDERYLPHRLAHRVVAARWLGIMNITASSLAAAARLPERGPIHYANLLHTAYNTILSNLANPALKADEIDLLESVLAQCERLSARWDQLASACEGIPQTLVHGDFIQKNVRIRYVQDEIIMLPYDWEKAGWGIPAEDISRVDLPTYWSTIQGYWSGLNIETIRRQTNVGKVFRCLVFLDWIAPRLAIESVEQPMININRCKTWLTDLIREAEWQS